MTRDEEDDLSYPLHWPIGRPRTAERELARFGQAGGSLGQRRALTPAAGRDRLLDELDRLGAANMVISSNLAGLSRAEPTDPGVAVYFELPGNNGTMARHCLACDKWTRVADNLAAIAAHVAAIRGQSRWGVGDVAQAFAGYRLLTGVGERTPWWTVLGVPALASPTTIKARRLELLQKLHPDKGGGQASANRAAEVNAAYEEAMRARGVTP